MNCSYPSFPDPDPSIPSSTGYIDNDDQKFWWNNNLHGSYEGCNSQDQPLQPSPSIELSSSKIKMEPYDPYSFPQHPQMPLPPQTSLPPQVPLQQSYDSVSLFEGPVPCYPPPTNTSSSTVTPTWENSQPPQIFDNIVTNDNYTFAYPQDIKPPIPEFTFLKSGVKRRRRIRRQPGETRRQPRRRFRACWGSANFSFEMVGFDFNFLLFKFERVYV